MLDKDTASPEIFTYGFGHNIGDKSMSDLLGGKGANLAEMSSLGMQVPMGITITTQVCRQYHGLTGYDKKAYLSDYFNTEVQPVLDELEAALGYTPLYAVRSGAQDSMPGMMDTLLNIGLTRANRLDWVQRLGHETMLDCRRRQLEMYGTIVEDCGPLIADIKAKIGKFKYGLHAAPGSNFYDSPVHVAKYIEKLEGFISLPRTAREQLLQGIRAVFDSWDSPRAQAYRHLHGIDDDLGTAVNIQMMVFGNQDKSASGVYFTRNAATGEPEPYGDFIHGGQGEDVVAGTHETLPIAELQSGFPAAYDQLIAAGKELEERFEDMVDIEFTIDNDTLWILQVRVGKRSAKAAFRIAHDLHLDGLIDKETAVSRVTAKQYRALRQVRIDLDVIPEPDYTGIAAGGSLVVGKPVGTAQAAEEIGKTEPVILVTDETTPEDFSGMAASVGILTRTGGATSHAAVVGRSLEKHCVVGCTLLPEIDDLPDLITIDGSTGRVWLQALPLTTGETDAYASILLGWGIETLAKADYPLQRDLLISSSLTDREFGNRYICADDSDNGELLEFLEALSREQLTQKVYLDLKVPGSSPLPEDAYLWGLTGAIENSASIKYQDRIEYLLHGIGIDDFKKNVVLVLSPDPLDGMVQQLSGAGWEVVSPVTSIDTLLQGGVIDLDPAFVEAIGGYGVVSKLLALMETAGQKTELLPASVNKDRLVFEVFGS